MKKIGVAFLCLIFLIGYLVIGDYFQIFLFCPIKKVTGFYCPGCGITRMCLSILKGEFYQAFRYNPLIFVLLPFFFCYFIDSIFSSLRNRKPFFSRLEPYLWYFLIVLFLGYGLIRNIPLFDFLRPTIIK